MMLAENKLAKLDKVLHNLTVVLILLKYRRCKLAVPVTFNVTLSNQPHIVAKITKLLTPSLCHHILFENMIMVDTLRDCHPTTVEIIFMFLYKVTEFV